MFKSQQVKSLEADLDILQKDNEELYRQIRRLISENSRLSSENSNLKRKLGNAIALTDEKETDDMTYALVFAHSDGVGVEFFLSRKEIDEHQGLLNRSYPRELKSRVFQIETEEDYLNVLKVVEFHKKSYKADNR